MPTPPPFSLGGAVVGCIWLMAMLIVMQEGHGRVKLLFARRKGHRGSVEQQKLGWRKRAGSKRVCIFSDGRGEG